MAQIQIDGRPTSDGELRFTPSGKAVFEFTLAENHRRKDGHEWVDDGASFYRVAVWGQTGETLAEQSLKGRPVLVTGRVRVREYETRDGGKGKSVDVTADKVALIPTRNAGPAQIANPGQQGAPNGAQDGSGYPGDPWGAQGSFSDKAPF